MIHADDLIRNIRLPDQHKRGTINWRAFKASPSDRGEGISVHKCGGEFSQLNDIERFRTEACLIDEGIIGVCLLSEEEASGKISAGENVSHTLRVDSNPVKTHAYGHLHCLIIDEDTEDLCPPKEVCEVLALRATKRKALLEMKRWPDVSDDLLAIHGLTRSEADERYARHLAFKSSPPPAS